jgi:general secretion pathway protein G
LNKIKRNGKIKHKKEEGFTFFEIIVALIIIAILSSLVGITVFNNIVKAQRIAAKSQIQTFSLALNSYYTDCGSFPTTEQGLDALWEKPSSSPSPEGWRGPYLDHAVPLDPWDNEYVYSTDNVPHGLPFEIMSHGPDGTEGGEGNNKDIVSWEELEY